MIWILSGAGALLAGLLLLRFFTTADPARMAKWIKYGTATAMLALGAYLALTGRMFLALLLGGWLIPWLRRKPSAASGDYFRGDAGQSRDSPRARAGLSAQEALEILGLQPGATREQIREAHKRLMQTCHPDHGGSDYLAARINAAKDVLLS